MQTPPCPVDEAQRLQALEQLDLMDTPAEHYLDTLVRLARDMFGVESALIGLVDHDRQWFKARIGLLGDQNERDQTFCAHALLGDGQMLVEDALLDPRFTGNPSVTGAPFIRMYAGQLLYAGDGQPIGTLCVFDPTPRSLDADERRHLRDLGTLAEGYLQLRALSTRTHTLRQAVDREQRKALLDPLTQLWNRGGLEQFFPFAQRATADAGQQLGVIFADLDHFKQVNDGHGHGAGDQVLWESARRLTAALRPDDLLVRLGGEEFVAVVAVHDATELAAIAERMRQTVAGESMLDGRVQQTISLGSALATTGETQASVLERADRALYRAKQQGRNRAVHASLEE
ncbi:sensor domain-containing diguanylate cyclase [Pseudomonas sp. UL073]|uniref:Sensor domain-containing diguanylate cyclase n=1 Tax=Zestomonas insulae TaxID=2809017 RepID=A0ABS2IGQ7_9GAMM|nr:sensor domain-containing diguanylate cyclase [Pseudomonas insulae]MBM7061343.1 sensor domain-containing diguanylate cyclase [Pseudomonas insulae]